MSSASSTFVALQSPTAVQVNGWAQGTLGYAQVVANQAAITAEVDLTSLTLTITVVAGRRIKITGACYAANTAAGNNDTLKIFEDGVQVMERSLVSGAISTAEGIEAVVVRTPAVGSHTWKLRMVAAAGTATMFAAATFPAFILVEDIGAV